MPTKGKAPQGNGPDLQKMIADAVRDAVGSKDSSATTGSGRVTAGKATYAVAWERRKAKAEAGTTVVVAVFRKGTVGTRKGFMFDTIPSHADNLADFLDTLDNVKDLRTFAGELRASAQAVRDAKPGRSRRDTASFFDLK